MSPTSLCCVVNSPGVGASGSRRVRFASDSDPDAATGYSGGPSSAGEGSGVGAGIGAGDRSVDPQTAPRTSEGAQSLLGPDVTFFDSTDSVGGIGEVCARACVCMWLRAHVSSRRVPR